MVPLVGPVPPVNETSAVAVTKMLVIRLPETLTVVNLLAPDFDRNVMKGTVAVDPELFELTLDALEVKEVHDIWQTTRHVLHVRYIFKWLVSTSR